MARAADAVRRLKSLLPSASRMSPVDTAWLRMDSPANLMTIVGIDLFEGPCDVPRLKRVLEHSLVTYPEFRSRVVTDPSGGAWWELDQDFDIDRHLVRIGLPGKGGKQELQKLVATLAAQALDPLRPLWQMHLVENYDGGHALIIRIHHCIADGIALIGVMLAMTTNAPDAPDPQREPKARADGHGEWWEPILRPLTGAAVRALDASGDLASRVLQGSAALINDPNLAAAAAGEYAKLVAQVSRDFAGIALMDPDTPTSLKGKPGGSKMVAWNEPLALPDVKAVGKALGCSVNDVLLACATGAVRAYLLERGELLESAAELRAMVPVNLRGPRGADSLGNKFGLVPLLLPIGIDHPVERVLEVHRRMNELKDGYMAVLAMGILGASGMAPRLVQQQVIDILAAKATAVMTNVPGPQHARYMAGARLKQMMFWVPQAGDIGVGVSILSYDGAVQFGVITDKKLCDDPQSIIDRFVPEFENLLHAVLLMPWDEDVEPRRAERALDATEALATAAGNLARREVSPTVDPGGAGLQMPVPSSASEAAGKANGHAVPAGLRRRRSAFAAARKGGGGVARR